MAQPAVNPLVGIVSDRAGIENDKIGVFVLCQLIAYGL